MAKIVLVGEARGAKEDLFDHGFVGASGAELARMLTQANLVTSGPPQYPSELDMIKWWSYAREVEDIEIANVFNLHPPDNDIKLFFTNAKEGVKTLPALNSKYVMPHLLCHVESLWQKITDAKPNLVIAFGNTACWALLGESKISVIRGTVKTSQRLGIKVLPTYHPAAVLRQWNLRPIVMADLEKAKREAEYSNVKRIKRYITIEPTLGEIEHWIEKPADYYAVDIETAFKQISMIGLARSADDAIVIPFIDPNKADWNYWNCIEDEMSAWKLADKVLRKPIPKVFQNGIFDLSYLLRAGLRPVQCQDDTMLLHHSIYPEMLKGLGFLGSVYSNEQSWKQMRTRGDNLKRDE